MKFKQIILALLLGYSSAASAFTLYDCNSIDDSAQVLTVKNIQGRAPTDSVFVTVDQIDQDKENPTLIFMAPKGVETNGVVTVNSFAGHDSKLKIIAESKPKFNLADQTLPGLNGKYCGRGPCPAPPKSPSLPHQQETITVAVLVHNGTTNVFQCND